MNFPLYKKQIKKLAKNRPGANTRLGKVFMWWFNYLWPAFNCRSQTHMLFFKLIWLSTGFGGSWNFSFKQKLWVALAGDATTQQTTTEWWGSKHDPLLPRTWSDSLGNISVQTMLFKRFSSQILHWTLENADFFQAANGADTICVFSSFQKKLRGWIQCLSGPTTSHLLSGSQPWRNMQSTNTSGLVH